MSSRSSTSSSSTLRRSIAFGALLLALGTLVVDRAPLPAIGFFGGEKLAEKELRLERVLEEGPVEVLAVGSSLVDLGFDAAHFTEISGRSAFNMGVSGTDTYWQSLYLREVLVPRLHPKVVLFGFRDSTRTKSAINRQYLAAPVLRDAELPGGEVLAHIASRLPQYRKRRLLDWLFPDRGRRGKDRVDERGMTITAELHRPKVEGDPAERHRMYDDYAVSAETARSTFEDTLRFLREENIQVVVFLTPYLATTFRRGSTYTRETLTSGPDDFPAWLTRVTSEANVPLVNLRYANGLSTDASLFFDSKHVNQLGAKPLAELLARVVETGVAPPEYAANPSPAEIAAMLGPFDADGTLIRPERAVPIRKLTCTEESGLGLAHAVARIRIETPGDYGVVLSTGAPAPGASYFLKVGDGPYRVWDLPPGPANPSGTGIPFDGLFALETGEQLLELHARKNVPLPDARIALVPAAK
ncbi:MAG TPA: hypothetical protein ENJ09_07200 [Planctomycetes bacterium]|nr:hypothetical protein [Planctomycetota bacterium]